MQANTLEMLDVLWAKKEERSGELSWLPLTVHLADAAKVSRWLWDNWISDNQRKTCEDSISGENGDAGRLASFLGAVYDIGMATPVYQKRSSAASRTLDDIFLDKFEEAGFEGIKQLVLADPDRTGHSLAGEVLLKGYGVGDDICSVVGSHGGLPVSDPCVLIDQSAYRANYYQSEKEDAVSARWKEVQGAIFEQAMNEAGFSGRDKLPEMSVPAQVIYSGILMLTDYITNNSDYFPLFWADALVDKDPCERFEAGIAAWLKDEPFKVKRSGKPDELFKRRFGHAPEELHSVVLRAAEESSEPGLMVIEALDGEKKTEAALVAAEVFCERAGSAGVFYGLCEGITAGSVPEKMRRWLRSLSDDQDSEEPLRLRYSGILSEHAESDGFEHSYARGINIEEGKRGSYYLNEWFCGDKREILRDFVVGSADSFLISSLKHRYLPLRHLGFGRKTVIIDGADLLDRCGQVYLEGALSWMGAYGVPVILIATALDEEEKRRLFGSYLKGKGVKKREMEFPEGFGGGYPLISYTDGKRIGALCSTAEHEDRKISVVKLSEGRLGDTLSGLLKNGGNVGVIVSSAERAQKLGKELIERFGEEAVEIFHEAFTVSDRKKKELKLVRRLGKNAKRGEKSITVATKVIDGLSGLDFDALVTDVCPADTLIVRLGMLQKYEDDCRPESFRIPTVYIMGASDKLGYETGARELYGAFRLFMTLHAVKETFSMPSGIRQLMDAAYGSSESLCDDELGRVLRRSRDEDQAERERREAEALAFRIEAPKLKIAPDRNNLSTLIKNPYASDAEEQLCAKVRGREGVLEVIALRSTGEGYAAFDEDTDIKGAVIDRGLAERLCRQAVAIPESIVPLSECFRITAYLKEYKKNKLPEFQKQYRLRNALGVVFDEDGLFDLDGIRLEYGNIYGLEGVIYSEEV